MPVSREELIQHYVKRIGYLQAEIDHHEALDTSVFPFDQMQRYKLTLSKMYKDLGMCEEVLRILKDGE